jgi:hypothetical protein
MAKTTGPLLSENAHGTVATILTFSKRKKINQCRFQRKQKDYTNAARETQRGYFSDSISWWHQMTKTEQEEFAGYDERDI